MGRLIGLLVVGMGSALGAAGEAWFVDGGNVSGVEDGTSWATAFVRIQPAIEAASVAEGGGEVWVAEGVYEEAISIAADNVRVYGGFAGSEAHLSQRDFRAHPTTLDGARARSGHAAEHVVSLFNWRNGRLDGFFITGGVALKGGGVYCLGVESSAVIANCVIHGNKAGHLTVNGDLVLEGRGGGIWLKDSCPTFQDCTVRDNDALIGAGVLIEGVSPQAAPVRMERCLVLNNRGSHGAGIWGQDAALELDGCVFQDNDASYGYGGAIHGRPFEDGTSRLNARARRCLFTGNRALGGAVYGGGQFEDCRFVGNTVVFGGLIEVAKGRYIQPRIEATNCVFALNGAVMRYVMGEAIDGNRPSSFSHCTFVRNGSADQRAIAFWPGDMVIAGRVPEEEDWRKPRPSARMGDTSRRPYRFPEKARRGPFMSARTCGSTSSAVVCSAE